MTYSFRILDARISSDRLEWLSLWNCWQDRDVAAHPDYVELFARECDRACCAALNSHQGGIIFPFVMRPLAVETWATGNETAFDLISPYGYGGPFAWGEPPVDTFWRDFNEWARNMNIIACFMRLSLFTNEHVVVPGENIVIGQNVVRSLTIPLDEIWMDYEHKVRKNVNKARKSGLEIQIDMEGTSLSSFMNIYLSTMDRRNALNSYYFPLKFFNDIIHKLPGQFAFFNALHEGKVVSTELVLVSSKYIYSFLGGTLIEAFSLRPNDLLKHMIIDWGIQQNKQAFILGGGYAADDGIFQYKRSFAPGGLVPFAVGKYVVDVDAYESYISMRQKFEAFHGREWIPKPGFFPAYRG